MIEQVQKLNGVIKMLDMPGVHVDLRDKNNLRERYRVRNNGSNAFERTDISVTYGFVVVSSYGAKNEELENSVISITREDTEGKIENKIAALKAKLQTMAAAEKARNGK